MSLTPDLPKAAATTLLGVPGYSFADLYQPERLASLYERFCEEVAAADPTFWSEWDAYRRQPDAPRTPLALSNLLVGMAPHVSRFVTRLFQIEPQIDQLRRATSAQDDLFRFKIDFVRRRALPLLKGGAHVAATADDAAVVQRLTAGASFDDLELAIARAGCALMDQEKTEKDAVAADMEALKRWCASRLDDRAYRDWVISVFPKRWTTGILSRCRTRPSKR